MSTDEIADNTDFYVPFGVYPVGFIGDLDEQQTKKYRQMCNVQREQNSYGDEQSPLITQRDGVWFSDDTAVKVEKRENPYKGTHMQLLIKFTDVVINGNEEQSKEEFNKRRPEDILLSLKYRFDFPYLLFFLL